MCCLSFPLFSRAVSHSHTALLSDASDSLLPIFLSSRLAASPLLSALASYSCLFASPLELEQKETTIKTIRGFDEREHKKRLIVVLENACVEVIKNGKEYQLMNSDDHAHLLTKKGRDVADARPDILHFVSLSLLLFPSFFPPLFLLFPSLFSHTHTHTHSLTHSLSLMSACLQI